jgi:hypothetical protein
MPVLVDACVVVAMLVLLGAVEVGWGLAEVALLVMFVLRSADEV